MLCGSLDGRRDWERMDIFYIYLHGWVLLLSTWNYQKLLIGPMGFPGGSAGKEPTMQETQAPSLGWEDPLEEERQPTPVFLPGESPWKEEPGRLQFIGSHRVRHNWVTNTSLIFQYKIKFKKKKQSWSRSYQFNPKRLQELTGLLSNLSHVHHKPICVRNSCMIQITLQGRTFSWPVCDQQIVSNC